MGAVDWLWRRKIREARSVGSGGIGVRIIFRRGCSCSFEALIRKRLWLLVIGTNSWERRDDAVNVWLSEVIKFKFIKNHRENRYSLSSKLSGFSALPKEMFEMLRYLCVYYSCMTIHPMTQMM